MNSIFHRRTLLSLRMLTGWCAILLISSCATKKAYDVEATPAGDIAVLHMASDFAVWMDNPAIIKLDGKYYGGDVVRLELLPGDHIVQMRCTRRFSTIFTRIPYSGPINVTVQASHDYNVYCDVTADKTYYWIEESGTGDLVGGERP